MNNKTARTIWTIVGGAAVATGALAALNSRIARQAAPLTPAIDGKHETYRWDAERISYTHAGDGPPMVLLHSHNAAASSYEMRRAFAEFAKDHRVYAPDLPGYGASQRRARPYSAQTYVRFIQDFLHDVVGEPAIVVASSVTAAQALVATAEDPTGVSRLVIISPTGLAESTTEPPCGATLMGSLLHVPVWGQALFNGITSRCGLRGFEEKHVYENPWNVTHEMVDYAWQTSHQPGAIYAPASFLKGSLWVDARDAYASAPIPVLAVWGNRDRINPYADSVPLLDSNPDARVCVITHSGALPQDEQTQEFAAVVRQFLS